MNRQYARSLFEHPLAAVVGIVAVVLFAVACSSDTNELDKTDPCYKVGCSGHGDCVVAGGNRALCMCDTGHYATGDGLECRAVIPGEECKDVDCNEGGTCVVVSGEPDYPRCICGPGFAPVTPTSCGPATCTMTPCAELVSGFVGIAENLTVEGGIIHTSYGTRIYSGASGEVMTELYTANSAIKALIAVDGTVIFSTFMQSFKLVPGAGEAVEIKLPAPSTGAIKGVGQWSFDGDKLICASRAVGDGFAADGASYGGKLVCLTLDGEIHEGKIGMSGAIEPVASRLGVAYLGNHVYYSRGIAILRVPRDSIDEPWDPASQQIASGLGMMAGDLAASGGYLYWVNENPQDWALKRLSVIDKSVETVLVIPEAHRLPVIGIIVYGGYLYWGIASGIWRVPAGGGVPEKRAGATLITAMVIDDGYIYYADQGTQEILRLKLQ